MSEWIEWNGGECPVDPNTKVEVWFYGEDDRVPGNARAGALRWCHSELRGGDIIAYRVVEQADYLENFRAAMREELSNWRDPKQVDGQHYTDLVIQPLDVAYLNGMNSARTKVLKYIMRSKNGLKDLEKAKDMVEKIALYEYGKEI